jgi:hypothetical protein
MVFGSVLHPFWTQLPSRTFIRSRTEPGPRDPELAVARASGSLVVNHRKIVSAYEKNPKQTPKNLTRRETVLLEHIRAGRTISDAAREAGFSKKWPGQAGSQAFKNIQKKIPKILDEPCARLCHAWGGELEQIQFLLGHVPVQTTERYLGCKQRIQSAVNDRIGIEPGSRSDALVPGLVDRVRNRPIRTNRIVDERLDGLSSGN